MSTPRTLTEEQQAFDTFIEALTQLSRQHGIALQAIGGVTFANTPEQFAGLTYSNDASSHDLEWTLQGGDC